LALCDERTSPNSEGHYVEKKISSYDWEETKAKANRDLGWTCKGASICRFKTVKRKNIKRSFMYKVLITELYLTSCSFYGLTLSINISHANT